MKTCTNVDLLKETTEFYNDEGKESWGDHMPSCGKSDICSDNNTNSSHLENRICYIIISYDPRSIK